MAGIFVRVKWRKAGETQVRTTDLRGTPEPIVTAPKPTVFAAASVFTTGGPTLVHGARFDETAHVWTDGVERATTFLDASRLLATAPAHAVGNVALQVVQDSGTSNVIDLAYVSSVVVPPSLTSATSVGAGGGTSTVTGTGFTPDAVVTSSNFTAGTTTYVNATTLTVVVPATTAGTKSLTVTQSSGVDTEAGILTVLPLPVVSSASSVTDVGGTTTVTGSNFTNPAVVWSDGVARATTYVNATTLTATVPAHAAGNVNLYVAQASGNSNTVSLAYTASLIDLALRTASVYLVADDFSAGAPDRLMGRASAGDSVNACYRRDLYAAYVGRGDDTANPTTTLVGGKKWLVTAGSSAGAIINAAGNAERKRSHILGTQTGAWSMTIACSWATLFGTTPQTVASPFGSTLYTCYFGAASDGRVGVVALDAGGNYQFMCLPAGSVVPGERCILQAQSDGSQARVRKRSGGVTGAWTALQPFTLYTVDSIWTALAHSRDTGPAFSGEFGGAFVERQYAPDMDAVLASFANKVGLP